MNLKSLALFAALIPIAALAQNPTPETDFRTLDHHKANLVRFDPTVDWSSYKQFHLSPSTDMPCNPAICLRPHDALKLTKAFDSSLRSAFKDVTAGDGPTLEIHPVITAVKQTDTLTNVAGFVLIQMPLSYGAASVHFELIDAATGRRVGDIDSARNARPWNIPPWEALQSLRPLGQTTVLLKSDAKRLRKDMKRLARLSATQPPSAASAISAGQ